MELNTISWASQAEVWWPRSEMKGELQNSQCRFAKIGSQRPAISHFVTQNIPKIRKRSLENDPGLSFIKKSWGLNIWKWYYLRKFLFFPVGQSFFSLATTRHLNLSDCEVWATGPSPKKKSKIALKALGVFFPYQKRYNFLKFTNRCFFWLFWPEFDVNLSEHKKSIQEA